MKHVSVGVYNSTSNLLMTEWREYLSRIALFFAASCLKFDTIGRRRSALYTAGFSVLQIDNQKLEFKAESKVGSLANVKHKPGGGDVKIFDDKLYLKQISGGASSIASSEEGHLSGTQVMTSYSMTLLTASKASNFIFAVFYT